MNESLSDPLHTRAEPRAERRAGTARLRRDAAFWFLHEADGLIGPDVATLAVGVARGIAINDELPPGIALTLARLAGEWLHLSKSGVPVAVASLAAARAAAQFARAEHVPDHPLLDWVATMAADRPPAPDRLQEIWRRLSAFWSDAPHELSVEGAERIVSLWTLLGSCETIMETGGDIRLLRDPQTELNGYGCSHRPRPWAITFASSTASSISERGYVAADRARMKIVAAMLKTGTREAILAEAAAVRRAIGAAFPLKHKAAVVLAASGTDSELLALALSHLAAPDVPITTILLAPEETGTGVPMAAIGRHFAIDTANGHDVARATPIDGFRSDTELVAIPLRDAAGQVRAPEAVEADILGAVTSGIGAGRRVILHALDLSKTGLLAPSMALLHGLRAEFGNRFDIVVDACQMRIAPERIDDYLAVDAIVQVTGSKFLTGPPFAGAVLMPPAIAARLAGGAGSSLPAGLDAYFSKGDWPSEAPVAQRLPEGANYGLLLRWRAALAEYRAFAAVTDRRKHAALERFGATVRSAIDRHGIFELQPMPALSRRDGTWDSLRTIFAFAIRPTTSDTRRLDPAAMRRLYRWLNADCAALFDSAAERRIASRICHIGQPVALPDGAGGQVGWLRVSAGARLISGEPSLQYMAIERRLDREMRDLTAVFDKLALLCRHWERLEAADPPAAY